MMSPKINRAVSMCACLAQIPLLGVILLGDFGFYFPGAMGAWSQFVQWIEFYLLVLVCGVVTALVSRAWILAGFQIGLPVIVVAAWWCCLSVPAPRLEAAEYQFLMGKPISEVEEILNRRRFGSSGLDGFQGELDADGQIVESGFQDYNGMTVIYSKDNMVIEVK